MKKHFLLLALGLPAILLNTACDYIEGPKKCYECIQLNSERKVLLEDFTGQTCGACPQSHRALDDLKDLYGEKIVAVALHAGNFAEPHPPTYPSNYANAMSEELAGYYNVATYPSGMVNRAEFGGNVLQNYANWGTQVAAELTAAPIVNIEMTADYDAATRSLNTDVQLEYFEGGDFHHSLVVVITEDSVISPQTDYTAAPPFHIMQYVHKHMLRASVTPGTWGDPLMDGNIQIGQQYVRNYSYSIPDEWDPAHCHLVVYVMDAESKYVYQVEELSFSGI